jgi:hypothetical protein
VLKTTDSTDPSALAWYTTPQGSRIAMIDTQGDTTGGVIIAWVVIGGADGFLVNPAQFTYVDKSFTDHGKAQAPSPGRAPGVTGRGVPVQHRLQPSLRRSVLR